MDVIYESVRRRFGRQIQSGQVTIMRLPSVEAARQVPNLDWVYLDGDHTYEGVRADLAGWAAALSRSHNRHGNGGCMIAGDDYGVKGWWDDGVTRAVDEFVSDGRGELTVIGTQFLIRLSGAD